MSREAAVLILLGAALLLVPTVGAAPSASANHYLPHAGDRFAYSETIFVANGTGDYSGYTDAGYYNGSISVTSVAPNGTANASYAAAGTYSNSDGTHYAWSEAGAFSFSGVSFLYVNGTDNQTGYVDPTVWFYMDASLTKGATFELLNTPMTVVSTNVSYRDSESPTGYVATIFAEGNGSYERDDSYGQFAATYTWKEYFDPATGYVVGYVYSEHDSDGAGDGFTYIDTLTDTSTSFPLTPAAAPPSSPSGTSSPSEFDLLLIALVVVVVIVVVVIVIALARRRPPLARHPTTAVPGQMPPYAPAPLHLVPGDQPAVQQVVIRETVMVPCPYCGTLMDATVTVCPKCGAPRP